MLLVGKQFEEEKYRLYELQNGKCLLCKRDLNPEVGSNHLDHDHELNGPKAGRIRGLLCPFCNALEGQILHKFNSSGLKSRDIAIQDWLISLTEYYSKDTSENKIHPVFIRDKTKQFTNLSKDDMIIEYTKVGGVYTSGMKKQDMVKLYSKLLRKMLK